MTESDVDPARSRLMSRIGPRDTKPELIVRRLLHSIGYRYKLHVRGLPGRPDLVFPARSKVIFVHGCFWHRYRGCRRTTTPKTRTDFWNAKFDANIERDERQIAALAEVGWSSLVVWECKTADPEPLLPLLTDFLGPPGSSVVQR